MTVQLSLMVNDAPIKTDYFVEGFIDHTVSGMVEALENTGKIKDLKLSIDGDEVTINLNGVAVPINAFVSEIISATAMGLVSTLKGVSEINKLTITLHK